MRTVNKENSVDTRMSLSLLLIFSLALIPVILSDQLRCSVGRKSERAEYKLYHTYSAAFSSGGSVNYRCPGGGRCWDWTRPNTASKCEELCKKNSKCCHWQHDRQRSVV